MPSSTYPLTILSDSPIGYWRLGEGVGTTAADSSGHGRDGSYVGTPTLGATGAIGDGDTAVTFDGSDDEVTNASTDLDLTAGPLTVEVWAKRGTGSSDAGLAGTGNAGFDGYALTWHNAASIFFYTGNAFVSASLSDATVFHHIVGTWDGTTNPNGIKLYIDGVLAAQGTATATTLSNTGFRIGRDTSSTRFTGTLDEVAVYASALSEARVQDHYAARLLTSVSPSASASPSLSPSTSLSPSVSASRSASASLDRKSVV